MARKKSAHGYELELRKMIKERTGAECEVWLYPQVRTTAGNMVVLDKVQEEVLGLDHLTASATGSTGQQKIVVDPLIPYYDKMQRTLMLQFEALGLNYKTMPSKVNEPTKKGGGDHDKLGQVLEDISNV